MSPPPDLPEVTLYTDGACAGNPGPGGWGAILLYEGREKELSGGNKSTTNNRMELMAVIKGLEALKQPCRVDVYSDSRYIVDAINKGWLESWIAKGWRKGRGKSRAQQVKNVYLWQRLVKLLEAHQVEFHWIPGHMGYPENERADRLAVSNIPK